MAATFKPFIAPMCERRSGRLVGIASVAGIRGLPGLAAYSLSKAGVTVSARACDSNAVHTAGVVTIAPGYIDTPLTQGNSYSMPFLMPADKFARQALDAIAAGVGLRVIPWQMGLLARVLRILPNWVYDRVLAGVRARRVNRSERSLSASCRPNTANARPGHRVLNPAGTGLAQASDGPCAMHDPTADPPPADSASRIPFSRY